MAETHHLGQRLSYDGALCTVHYIGDVDGTTGTWLGVEWDDPSRGKHDGHHKGTRYFECLSRSRTAASFVRPSRRADKLQSFVAALLEKYATESGGDAGAATPSRNPEIEIIFFGKKVAEEVGFDKIRRQLARVEELKIVILDGMRIAWDVMFEDGGRGVKDTSPLIFELDLSRNLFESFGTVVRICRELEGLKSLRLNGNRFQIIHPESEPTAKSAWGAFREVRELELEETLLSWENICEIATNFPALNRLSASLNQFTMIPENNLATLASTLTTVDLEFNDFTSLADVAPLASLTALRSLHLKGNAISAIQPDPDAPPPIFAPSLAYLDVSYNAIASWSFIDALPTSIHSLSALRLSHNPLWANPVPDAKRGPDDDDAARTMDEAHMITTARLPTLKTLNFATITTQDRTNAELFYLSRIARQLSSVPEEDEARVLTQHPLYVALCETYGEPDIVRRDEVDPNFLEARLVRVQFVAAAAGLPAEAPREGATEIPRSFDVYAVKAIAGRMFGVPPLGVRLVWETGEWDPVGGFDEEVGESSDEEDGLEAELAVEVEAARGFGEEVELRRGGRWVKREVELVDGPRQLGFCVDGLSARIRVEVK